MIKTQNLIKNKKKNAKKSKWKYKVTFFTVTDFELSHCKL